MAARPEGGLNERMQESCSSLSTAAGVACLSGSKSSQYKGVHWDKTKTKWVGYIHMNGKKHHLGYFQEEVEAARAYDRESLRCRGFTKNFPCTEYSPNELAQEPEVRKAMEKSSRYIGVSWNKLRRKWAARIIVDGRSQHLGHFGQEVEAARAYDKVCLESRGTTKNFPAEEYLEGFPSHNKTSCSGSVDTKATIGHLVGAAEAYRIPGVGVDGECASRGSGVEENSQDSSTCAESNKTRLEEGGAAPQGFAPPRDVAAEAGQFVAGTMALPNSGFNLYQSSPPKPSVPVAATAYQAVASTPWQQPAGSTAGVFSVLPHSNCTNLTNLMPLTTPKPASPTLSHQSGSAFFAPAPAVTTAAIPAVTQPQTLHAPKPYNTTASLQPLMQSMPLLQGMPGMFKSISSLQPTIPTATMTPAVNTQSQLQVAQLQAWAQLANAGFLQQGQQQVQVQQQQVFEPPVLGGLTDGNLLKRRRLDSVVAS